VIGEVWGMDKKAVVDRIAKQLEIWPGDAKNILEAAGFFEIVEAAKNLCREPITPDDMINMFEILKKAGVWDE
jgi:hypothetical protein